MLALVLPLIGAALIDSVCTPSTPRLDVGAPVTCTTPAIPQTLTPSDTTHPRRRAVEVSDGYATRLAIHRYASYTLPPLFIAEYILGDKLIDQKADAFAGRRSGPPSESLRNVHVVTAIGIGTLFTLNTVTGLWNLKDSWHVKEGRRLRNAHVLLMLAADAGFAATGFIGSNAVDGNLADARLHRTVGLSSMGVGLAAASLMWFGKK